LIRGGLTGDRRPGRRAKSFERLLREDSLQARTEVYLRLLYSRIAWGALRRVHADQLPAATYRLIENIDKDRISGEREARLRNLASFIRRGTPSLFELLGEAAFAEQIVAFADSSDFWKGKGRTLVEAFCLFCVRGKRLATEEGRDLAKLTGIASGILSDPRRASPWANTLHRRFDPPRGGLVAEESFECGGDLLSYVDGRFDVRHVYSKARRKLHVIRVTLSEKEQLELSCLGLK
jgi:hypothetical protein